MSDPNAALLGASISVRELLEHDRDCFRVHDVRLVVENATLTVREARDDRVCGLVEGEDPAGGRPYTAQHAVLHPANEPGFGGSGRLIPH